MTQTDFRNQVDNLMNILFGAGVASHATIIEQINYLVFLRSLSRKDDNAMILDPSAEKIFSGELRKYHWDNLLILNADELFNSLEEVFRKLPEITTNQTIKLLFRDAHVKVFDKPTLRRLVHEIEKMFSDLEKQATAGHTDIFGDMYEYLLSKLSQAGTLGSFRTPRHIIKFIVDVIDPKKSETILDPACGTAGFLVAALKHLEEEYSSDEFKKLDKYPMDLLTPQERDFVYKYTFTGFDSDFDMFKFGLMNLYLHKLEHPNMKRQNTLVDTAGDRTKWDVILANPPFAGALDIDSISEDLRMGTRSTEILFLRYIIDHLSSSGRAGVIVPEGVVFNSTNAHKKIRQMLVEDAGLWCVVSLPAGIFNPYAGVKTSILFFDKSLKDKIKDILFVKVENDGFDLGATKKPINKNDLPIALTAINIYKKAIEKGKMADFDLLLNSNAVTTSIENIKELGYDLTADDHVTLVKAINKVLQSEIKNHDYNLNGDQYGNEIIKENTKWPIVKLGEICEITSSKRVFQSEWKDHGIPFYRAREIVKLADQGFVKNELFISEEMFSEYSKKYGAPKEGDLMVTGVGTLGICYLVKKNDKFYFKDGNIIWLKNFNDNVDSRYVEYLFKDEKIKKQISSFSVGGTVGTYTIINAKNTKIPFPPLEIQKQIVEELDGYQKIIDGAKQIVENWKPNIFLNKEWQNCKLHEISTLIKRGKTPSYGESNIQVIKSGQARGYFDFDFSNKYFVNESFSIDERKLKKGDLLLNSTGVGTAGRVTFFNLDGDFLADGHITIIRLDKTKANPLFVLFALASVYGFKNIEKMARGNGGQIELSRETIQNLSIPLPLIEEQNKIVDQIEKEKEMVDPLKKLIGLYQEKINQKIEEVWG